MCLADITDTTTYARVAQLVEHDLAKVGAAGSSPVSRSLLIKRASDGCPFLLNRVLPDSNGSYLRSTSVGAGLCFFSFIRDEGVAGAFFQRNKSTYWPLAWLVLNSETHV